jgi:DNA-directed RNA polymerase specialized sigma24 family protein
MDEIDENASKIKFILENYKNLPKLEREVFEDFYINGLDTTEISEVYGITIGCTKTRLFNSRKKILNMYETFKKN